MQTRTPNSRARRPVRKSSNGEANRATQDAQTAPAAPASSAQSRILAAIRAVPPGSVAGYGAIARRAGLPGRARLVARLLAGNDDATLPWHRIVRSDGRIAFPAGSEGHAEQARRLRAEGVCVEAGRVRGMPGSDADLDALLWAPPGRSRAPAAEERNSPPKRVRR